MFLDMTMLISLVFLVSAVSCRQDQYRIFLGEELVSNIPTTRFDYILPFKGFHTVNCHYIAKFLG